MSNTWAICPKDRDNSSKGLLIPDDPIGSHGRMGKGGNLLWDEPAAHQLVGRVTAYQGYDG